jgi:folate-binding protein YgfZ
MVTNDVAALAPGQGCYAFLLDPTGHVLADARVLCTDDHLLLDVEPGRAPFVAETLDRYLIMEKCRIADVTGETAQVFLGGTAAAALLARQVDAPGAVDAWREGQNALVEIGGVPALVAAATWVPGPGFAVYLPRHAALAFASDLAAAGVPPLDAETFEALRIEAGVPRFGADITEKVLAPETGQQARAISYRKGCYIGQEIVARIDARGHTNRTLAGFWLGPGPLPPPGANVEADGRSVGYVTSAALSPTWSGRPIALGYVRREHGAAGTPVTIAGARARVAVLPFGPPPAAFPDGE